MKEVWFPGDRAQRHKLSGRVIEPGVNLLPDDLADQLLGSGLVQPLPNDLGLGSDPDWPPPAPDEAAGEDS